jgi:hypothetical protein
LPRVAGRNHRGGFPVSVVAGDRYDPAIPDRDADDGTADVDLHLAQRQARRERFDQDRGSARLE